MKQHFEKILEAVTAKIVDPNTDYRFLPELIAAADLAAKRIGIIDNPGKKNGEAVN
jgi:hypothetical protein